MTSAAVNATAAANAPMYTAQPSSCSPPACSCAMSRRWSASAQISSAQSLTARPAPDVRISWAGSGSMHSSCSSFSTRSASVVASAASRTSRRARSPM